MKFKIVSLDENEPVSFMNFECFSLILLVVISISLFDKNSSWKRCELFEDPNTLVDVKQNFI